MEFLVASTSTLFLSPNLIFGLGIIELIKFFALCNGWFGWVFFSLIVVVCLGILVVELGIFVN